MRKDADAVALANAKRGKRTSHALHRQHRLFIGQRDVAINPVEGEPVRCPLSPVDQQLVHQHPLFS